MAELAAYLAESASEFTEIITSFAGNARRFTKQIAEFVRLNCCFTEIFVYVAGDVSECTQVMVYSKEIIFGFAILIVQTKDEKCYFEIFEPKFITLDIYLFFDRDKFGILGVGTNNDTEILINETSHPAITNLPIYYN